MKKISYREFAARLSEKSKKFDFPNHGAFELTPLCNLDCKMCYVHVQNPAVKEQMLNGDQWISIMQDAVKSGMLSALLTGGEALTHPDFRRIYMFLVENGVSVRLKSNGLLLRKNLDFLKKYPPNLIDISLYGCNSESYLAVTGHDAFHEVCEGIRAVLDAGLTVRLMITPSKYMEPWTEEVMKFAKTFPGVAKVIVNSLLVDAREDTGRAKEEFVLTQEQYFSVNKKRKEMFPLKFMPPEEEERIYGKIEKTAHVSDSGLYCNSGRNGFAVSWDGTMEPCLDFPKELLSADVLHEGFEAAWEKINQGIRKYSVPDKCHSCPINTKCHYCPLQHGKFALKHECDESVCAYWHNVYDNQKD